MEQSHSTEHLYRDDSKQYSKQHCRWIRLMRLVTITGL